MPSPEESAGLEPGGGVRPGDTPPAESSMPGGAGGERDQPNKGPVAGNRTPMIITLAFIGLIVVSFIGYGIAEIAGYLN